jgi:hypothetical protein
MFKTLAPDTVDELPIALPVLARQDRHSLVVDEPGWIEKSGLSGKQRYLEK